MKCPYCGSDNRDDAVTCEICEMPLKSVTPKRTVPRVSHTQPSYVEEPSYGACPNCGAPLNDCTPVSKTSVTSSGGGYGFFSGCCGAILLGPLGLLCGLKKQNITSSSQTWWVCRRCGKEFVEKETAKEIANNAITSAAIRTFVIAVIWAFLFATIYYDLWIRNIALLAIAGTWIVIPTGIREATGYTLKELLTAEERKNFYKQCAFYGIIALVLGLVICTKVLDFLLE